MHHQALLSALKEMVTERQQTGGMQAIAEFGRDLRRFSSLDSAKAQYLYARRDEVLQLLRVPRSRQELLAHAEAGLRATIWRHNQYLSARDLERRRLQEHYRKLLADIERALAQSDSFGEFCRRLRPVLAAHHSRLWRTSRNLVEGRFSPEMPGPPCSEYTVRMQCEVLRLLEQPLMEPVLDIGCGEHASLVRWLNESGVEAYGIDRLVADGERTWRKDWFVADARWQQRRWGTIISHLAFSNHFVHQHLRADGEAEHYARHFIAILGSLQRGGCFIYAPALAFIEPLLPERFAVSCWKLGPTGLQASRITRLV